MSRVGSLMTLAAAFVAMPVMAEPTPSVAEIGARNFVQSLIEGGVNTKEHVARDAMIIVGDIGGPLAELLREEPSFAKTFAGCHIVDSKELPTKVSDGGFGNPDMAKGRTLTQVDVKLDCKTGATSHVAPMQVFVDGNRVVLVMIGNGPTNG